MRKPLLEPLLLRLARVQVERPWLIVALAALTMIPAVFLASRLELKTSFSELLPDNKPSVIELDRIGARLTSASTLTVVAEGSNPESLKRFVDAVAPRIRKLDPALVSGVDDGTREAQKFFEQNKHLYADLADLTSLRDQIKERYDYEVGKRAGYDLGLDDEAEAEEQAAERPRLDPASIEERLNRRLEEARKKAPGLDGYYIGEKGKLAAVLVRTPLSSGSEQAFELRRKIEGIVAEVNPKAWDPAFQLGFTGNLITSAEQHRTVTRDLTEVGAWGVSLVLAVVFLFFLRVRMLIAMGLTIGLGSVWSFAFAELAVGNLNTATGFLVSIIAGNGINFGIIFMARFIEARRDQLMPLAESIRLAHTETYIATLAAAGAAMIAYGSLSATDFRGFRDFGVIAGAGMVLCWLATYLFLPAVLVLSERVRPMFQNEPAWRTRLKGVYGIPAAWLARRFPVAIGIAGVLLGVAGFAISAHYLASDPMEYDLANVRNDRTSPTSAGRLSVRVDKVVGRLGQDGRAILTERLDQVPPLVKELERRRDAAPPDTKPFDKVVSIFDLLPQDQPQKLALLAEIKDLLDKSRRRGAISDADWQKIEPHVPEHLKELGIDDLPEQVARSFTEKDGSRGKIVYIVPAEGHSVYDAHYLMRWADSFREVKLPNGELIRGTGDPVIFSDMLLNVKEDAPKAIFLSFLGTIGVILLTFRGRSSGFWALAALLLGLSWLVSILALTDVKLNFLNFVAMPIAVGVGADYAINIMQRREQDGDAQLYRVLVQTGGAVTLCSLTTMLGYLALLFSINRAVRSFGFAGALGELTALVASGCVLPAILFWRARRAARHSGPESAPRSVPRPQS